MPSRLKRSAVFRGPSKSYLRFEGVIHRSLNLLSLQAIFEKTGLAKPVHGVEFTDLSRAATVLAVAAMDAYFTGVFGEYFILYLKKNGGNKHISDLLTRAGLDVDTALQLLAMERPLRRIRHLIDEYLERRTSQRIHSVDDLFLAYNITNFSDRVQALRKRRNLLRSVELLIERRHVVAHEGDMNAHGRLRPIQAAEIRRRIEDLQSYVAGADELLQKHIAL
jgi:hypothetical protein